MLRQIGLFTLVLGIVLSTRSDASCAAQEIALKTQAWENSDDGFAEFNTRIRARTAGNLLARPGVCVVFDGGSLSQALLLTDGQAGQRGGDGRVMPKGTPAVFNFYLGEPKMVREVGTYTFNGDTRANQDFEVRWANNSANPGMPPDFPDKPNLTSGPEVIGSDRGGFHSRFVSKRKDLLTREKVDWVQFRIWSTHKRNAGDKAKTDASSSPSAYVELEVLGTKDDVVQLSEAQRADQNRIQDLASEPPLVVRDTWQETMIASREALLAWETAQDRMAIPNSGVVFEPWYLLGPLSQKSEAYQELKQAKRIDLARRYPSDHGKPIGWVKREDLIDGKMHDLTGHHDAGKNDVLLLCRTVRFAQPKQRDRFSVQIHADGGRGLWLPTRRGHAVQKSFVTCRSGSEVRDPPNPGQFLLELRQTRDRPCRFRFLPQPTSKNPGAGHVNTRLQRRRALTERVLKRFTDPSVQAEMRWEMAASIWRETRGKSVEDWFPGQSAAHLKSKYRQAVIQRVGVLREALTEEQGIRANVLARHKDQVAGWFDRLVAPVAADLEMPQLREKFHQLCTLEDALTAAGKLTSLRLSVEDQQQLFGDRYPQGKENLQRIVRLQRQIDAVFDGLLTGKKDAFAAARDVSRQIEAAGSEILLRNPLLDFERLLVMHGAPRFASNWGGPNRIGERIQVLSPVRPDGQLTTIHEGSVSDVDLHWDGRRILFSDGKAVWEMQVDGTALRRVTPEDSPVTHYDACYLPSGQILCVSNACEQAVPCTGGANVGNLHLMDADGSNEHRITFDQDHNWNPVVMHDGRVLYSRWEYTDTPHYFSRLLFRMNPDGTNQKEYYGSNSYWPNATYWPRPIPGHPTMISCIVSGHHGVSRSGELVVLDPAQGRHEADGAVQKIPGYGKRVEPTMKDGLVTGVWPQFAAPYPLAEPGSHLGAGKYFLACVKQHPWSTWDLCLVDVFDNITPILCGGYMTPIPLRSRPMPPVIAPKVDRNRDDALVYVTNVYEGPGLQGYPAGSIKRLRVGSHHYRYAGNGDTRASSLEGGWDVKKILGTVPVNEDGSCLFRVPANTPIFVQPLDDQHKAQQIMRSWFSAMPGETVSCVGCHEKQNDAPPSRYSAAGIGRAPAEIEPWYGPLRGFSFDREVQPVLDRRCAGCHNGQPYKQGDQQLAIIDLRAKRLHGDLPPPDPNAPKNRYGPHDYSPAYIALQRYVRRPGYEGDYHMPKPAEYEADTSTLVKLLKKGHYHVQLTRAEWERLYTWIDFNVPYPAYWGESHRPPKPDQVERRALYKKLYAGIDDRDEQPLPLPPVAKYLSPQPAAPRPKAPELAGWPFSAEEAARLQTKTKIQNENENENKNKNASAGKLPGEETVDLGDGVVMPLVLIPAGKFVMGSRDGFDDECRQAVVSIDQPFYMGQFEVTNAQYARFDPDHDSGVINERWKDRSRRGTPINDPQLPVVRISWHQAMAFCAWLSEQTGRPCTLPTEAQWEWACRAGTATDFAFGDYEPGSTPLANIADETARGWNHDRAETGYNDGIHFTAPGGRFPPNAWGLCDMHGNVAEWCLTGYHRYPYRAGVHNDPTAPGEKVVRGGSWNDTLRFATSASRWRYLPYKPVYDVGFRVVLPAESLNVIARSDASR